VRRVRSGPLTARPATLTPYGYVCHDTEHATVKRKTHDTASESRRAERSRARMREVASTVSCGLDDTMLHTRPTLLSDQMIHPTWRPPTQMACKFAPERAQKLPSGPLGWEGMRANEMRSPRSKSTPSAPSASRPSEE